MALPVEEHPVAVAAPTEALATRVFRYAIALVLAIIGASTLVLVLG